MVNKLDPLQAMLAAAILAILVSLMHGCARGAPAHAAAPKPQAKTTMRFHQDNITYERKVMPDGVVCWVAIDRYRDAPGAMSCDWTYALH